LRERIESKSVVDVNCDQEGVVSVGDGGGMRGYLIRLIIELHRIMVTCPNIHRKVNHGSNHSITETDQKSGHAVANDIVSTTFPR